MALIDRLNAIGNAIREKNGTTELIPLADMPQAILNLSGGGGFQYQSIVYNNDDTITLKDIDGVTHTMVCTYDGDKLVSVSYDGKEIKLNYDGDRLTKIGNIEIDFSTLFVVLADTVYSYYGVSKEDYPYLSVEYLSANKCVYVCFAKTVNITSSKIVYNDCFYGAYGSYTFTEFENIEGALQYALDNIPIEKMNSKTSWSTENTASWTQYINFDKCAFTGTIYNI